MNEDRIIHRSPFRDWYATQDASCGVWLCDKASDQKVKIEPPAEWEAHWAWNVTEDGAGIYFKRTVPETKAGEESEIQPAKE